MAVSVGIDLGTTFSAVAYVDTQTQIPRIIPNSEGNKITPSIIQFLNGRHVFGTEAESAFAAGEPGCVTTFKRSMGKPEVYCTIDGQSYTAEELSALLLRHLKEEAEAELGDTIKEVVITVPAYFYSPHREATLNAATAAGLKVKKIIDEPNAAVMAYGLNNWRENANILVYDLGGGTFDVTLTRMGRDGELATITTKGNSALGGRDWDDRMELLLLEKFEDETGIDMKSDPKITAILRGLTEGVKKKLSAMATAKVTTTIPDYGVASITISREEFEENTADLINRTGEFCSAVLDEAAVKRKDVTDVLLVGGSTRMPQVSKYILNMFGKKPITHVNPDEAVVLGAAIQATKENETYTKLSMGVTADGKKVTDRATSGLSARAVVKPSKKLSSIGFLNLREITAHAMGIVAIHDEGQRYYNEIIIPANHPRPVRAAKKFRFYTSPKTKNELEIYVLQGDSENPLDCIIPYKYVVTGIQHINKGEKIGTVIRVQYSYDENGIIHIQARQGNGNVDLPIRKDEVPSDISGFGKPIAKDQPEQAASLGMQLGRGTSQNLVHKYEAITFSNVEWEKYDNISSHPSGAEYNEPSVHVVANEENIEFHGYNVSQMDEGVSYTINAEDDFEIECGVNTSTIQPHPGGNMMISLGIISASLNEDGGHIIMGEEIVAKVGSKFKLKMSLTDGGLYEVYIDNKLAGSKTNPTLGGVDVMFGFAHDAHCCPILSHAYVSGIKMKQRANQASEEDSSETDTWEN